MRVIDVEDLQDPRLAVYREINRKNLTRASGRFIAEGRWLVERLLNSDLQTESIVCGHEYLAQLPQNLPDALPVYRLPAKSISELIGFQFHRGMLACGLRPANAPLNQIIDSTAPETTLVVCPDVVDPTNLGSVIRNGSAFGASGLLLGPNCADPYSRRVVRVSMGNVFQLPIRVAEDLSGELHDLHIEHGFTRYATILGNCDTLMSHMTRPRRIAIVFGSEGHGLSPESMAQAEHRITLPMHRNTDSLNLATSTGVFLYHFTCIARRS
jgi:tRNA G18 (ribose-2'-O)-methylase SpoU